MIIEVTDELLSQPFDADTMVDIEDALRTGDAVNVTGWSQQQLDDLRNRQRIDITSEPKKNS